MYGRDPGKKDVHNVIRYPVAFSGLGVSSDSFFIRSLKFIRAIIRGVFLVRKRHVKHVLGFYRDESSFVLSYLISLLTSSPLSVYMTDLYAENYNSKRKKLIQELIFRRAQRIFCVTEAMRIEYKNLYDIDSVLIPHSVDVSFQPSYTKRRDKFRILFSGSIVYDRLQLLRSLVNTFKDEDEYEILLLCPHDEAFLVQNNLVGKNVFSKYIENEEQYLIELSKADLLYIPLTFEPPTNQRSEIQLRTCLGTKSFDYMRSGSPILVHSPSNYWTYQYFKQDNSAWLLSENSGELLKREIEKIRQNPEESEIKINNAKNQILKHDSGVIYDKLIMEIVEKY